MKTVCIVTSTRAEYGLLEPLIKRIHEDKEFDLMLVVTGTHLLEEHGETYKEIRFPIYKKIYIPIKSQSVIDISNTMTTLQIEFSKILVENTPDIVVLLGDRYEILAVAIACMIANVPIAHIHGGETTEGAIDEAIRHSITKMSYLHFPSTYEYARRIIQLGEEPSRVFNVGALGAENIYKMKLLSKTELEAKINFKIDNNTLLFTYHPTTLHGNHKVSINVVMQEMKQVFKALDNLQRRVIFTKANADMGGIVINQMIDEYVDRNNNRSIAFISMGKLRYLSAMKYVGAVVGNSSSGIIEAPIMKVPTVNIGARQQGRLRCESIIDCGVNSLQIEKAVEIALSQKMKEKVKNIENPYGEGDTSKLIVEVLKKYLNNKSISLQKKFYDINFDF